MADDDTLDELFPTISLLLLRDNNVRELLGLQRFHNDFSRTETEIEIPSFSVHTSPFMYFSLFFPNVHFEKCLLKHRSLCGQSLKVY